MFRLHRRFGDTVSAKQSPKFFVPVNPARTVFGRYIYMRLPTGDLAAEICFGSKKHLHKSAMNSFICTGELSSHVVPIEAYAGAAEIGQLLEADLDFRSTEAYSKWIKLLGSSHRQRFHAREMLTVKDVEDYFLYVCNLIRSMQSHGCISRCNITSGHPAYIPEFSPNRKPDRDIGCAIGPAGEIWMFRSGHHRLHIARQLGIANIPVEVHFIHWQWVMRCLSAYRGNPLSAVVAGLNDIRASRGRQCIAVG